MSSLVQIYARHAPIGVNPPLCSKQGYNEAKVAYAAMRAV